MNRKWLAIGYMMLSASLTMAQTPQVLSIGAEEYAGPNGRLSTIATDAKGQPHIASDGGTMCFMYDKINGAWLASSFNSGSYGSSQYYEPHLEIDRHDVGWCSGSLYGGIRGLGFLLRTGMSTGPSAPGFSQRQFKPFARGGDMGNLSLDIAKDEAVSWASEKYWGTYVFDATAPGMNRMTASGLMYCGVGGECNGLGVSRAGMRLHANGKTHSIWHVATVANGGYGYSMAQNSLRFSKGLGSIPWGDGLYYSGMGTDGSHVRIVGDNKKPETAYIGVDFSSDGGMGGVWGNVVDGATALRPISDMLCYDRTGTAGLRRYAPDIAAAKNGGAFIIWQNGSRLKIRYISQKAELGPVVDICTGYRAAIHADAQGNLHIAYHNNGVKYRKILVSGGGGGATLAGDYNNDGRDDLAVYDSANNKWYIYNLANGSAIAAGLSFGPAGSSPVPGDYNGDNYADPAVYDSATGKWYIYDLHNRGYIVNGLAWGPLGATPMIGDYNGDGYDDPAFYDDATGKWYAYNLRTSSVIANGVSWGFPGAIPVPADYNGDGYTDLGIYDGANGKWYVYNLRTASGITAGLSWGFAGATPIAADYNLDGHADLGIYDGTTGKWFVYNLRTGNALVYNMAWGFAGVSPIKGNYAGNKANELTVYDNATGKWYIYNRSSGTAAAFGLAWGGSGMIPMGSAN